MYILLIVAVAAYLIGSINSSIIVGKLWGKIDIRNFGSGNAGATNTLRTLGIGPTILVIIGDALKGVIAILIGWFLAKENGGLIAGLFAVVGHNWPVYFQFKGGKGILTSAFVILMVSPKEGGIAILIALAIMAITRYVSLGSVAAAALYPILIGIMEAGKPNSRNLFIFAVLLAVLAIYRHRSNIKRLINGTESKLGQKKA